MAVILEQDADARVGPQRIHIEYAFLFRDPKCHALFDQPIGIMADEYVGVTVFRAPDGEGSGGQNDIALLCRLHLADKVARFRSRQFAVRALFFAPLRRPTSRARVAPPLSHSMVAPPFPTP